MPFRIYVISYESVATQSTLIYDGTCWIINQGDSCRDIKLFAHYFYISRSHLDCPKITFLPHLSTSHTFSKTQFKILTAAETFCLYAHDVVASPRLRPTALSDNVTTRAPCHRLAMESVIYQDSPLADYLEGILIRRQHTAATYRLNSMLISSIGAGEIDQNWNSVPQHTPPLSPDSNNINFAPRGPPTSYTKFRRKVPAPLKVQVPGSSATVARLHDTCKVRRPFRSTGSPR